MICMVAVFLSLWLTDTKLKVDEIIRKPYNPYCKLMKTLG